MKCIIAGSRTIQSYSLIEQAIAESGFDITEVVHGDANGVDQLGQIWGKANKIPVIPFPAAWDDFEVENVFIKVNKFGKRYNALAGFNRNQDMVDYADALIAIRKNKSPGTTDIIERAKAKGLKVFVKDI